MSANTLELNLNLTTQVQQLFAKTSTVVRRPVNELPELAGITPFTTIDYPAHLSAVLFLQGCPLRCTYCHNQHLLSRDSVTPYDSEYLKEFLKRRKNRLDAIVISGGEPLMQQNISNLIGLIKDHGFKVGLHTSGAYPERLDKIIKDIDWIGFDFKALFHEYEQITKVKGSGQKAFESAQIITNSSVDYEFRTTVTEDYHTEEKLIFGAQQISRMGVKKYSLQKRRDATNKTKIHFSENLIGQVTPLFETLTVR